MKKITWESNGYYQLLENGTIIKPDGYVSSKEWQWIGMVEKKPFGRYSSIIKREDCFKISNFKYKNGKLKYMIVDIDHGTKRIWAE